MAGDDSNGRVAHVNVSIRDGEKPEEVTVRTILSPTFQAAYTLANFNTVGGAFEADDLIKKLEEDVTETLKGKSLEKCQQMLAAQAVTLDGLFNVMIRHAANNLADNLSTSESLFKLGLKAQSQCRTTLEALNEIKNPRPTNWVRQANISNGHQQVNNHAEVSRAEEIENPPNELFEEKHNERLDFGAQAETGRNNQALEALGEIDGANKRAGERKVSP